MNKLYNEETKERFLTTYDNEQTQKTLRNVFYNSELEELRNGKDLYDFNLTQIGEVIKNSNPHSSVVARATGRFISQYISWAIGEKLRGNINPLKGVNNEWYDGLVDKSKKIHWAEDEFYSEIIEKLDNAQDQALVSLIFEGILGKGFSELKEIVYNNINWNKNEITIKRNGENKVFVLSNRTMRYVENAHKSQTYRILNTKTGELSDKEVVSSDYLFKNVKSPRTKEGEPLSLQTFYGRMNSIKEKFDLEYLTPNALRQSGMIKMAAELVNEKVQKGEEPIIGYDEFAIIGERYDSPKMTQNGYTYYNTFLMKEYLNEQNIKELYDLDVTIQKR